MTPIFTIMICMSMGGQSLGCKLLPDEPVFGSLEACKERIERGRFAIEGDIRNTFGCVTKYVSTWEPAQ